MLEDYIERCDAVVHFIGEMAGSTPAATSVDDLLRRRPELAARLADKGMGREALGARLIAMGGMACDRLQSDTAPENLVIVAPAESAERGEIFRLTEASRASQAEHLRRLQGDRPLSRSAIRQRRQSRGASSRLAGPRGTYRRAYASEDEASQSSALSLGGLFAGREAALDDLRTALLAGKGGAVALHGLGGVGKTRLAIEYGWAREADYSALLFVSASDAASLNAGFAALDGPRDSDLPEKEARDDATKITAACAGWRPTRRG